MGAPRAQVITEARASGAQVIDGSLNFSNTDQHLTKTITTAGNRRTWTFSCWAKRSSTGSVPVSYTHLTLPTKA